MSSYERKKRLYRVETLLEGTFHLHPRLLVASNYKEFRILRWPYQVVTKATNGRKGKLIQEESKEDLIHGTLIIPKDGTPKLAFMGTFTTLFILDYETDGIGGVTSAPISEIKEIRTPMTGGPDPKAYNPVRKEFLRAYHPIWPSTTKHELRAYNLEGKETYVKELKEKVKQILVIGKYILLLNTTSESSVLLDSSTYEELKDGFYLPRDITFFRFMTWYSPQGPRLLASNNEFTYSYDLDKRLIPKFGFYRGRVSGHGPFEPTDHKILPRSILKVVNGIYGIRSLKSVDINYGSIVAHFTNLQPVESHYNSLVDLDTGKTVGNLPISSFQADGYDRDHLLLVNNSKILGNRIFSYNIVTGEEENLYTTRPKIHDIKYAYFLEGSRNDKKILRCILRRRMFRYLPRDLILEAFSFI
jgi:hypothetical protein